GPRSGRRRTAPARRGRCGGGDARAHRSDRGPAATPTRLMDETLRHQRDTSLGQLERLMQRGRQIRAARSVDATRAWQQECAAAINQLSGGSKAHWLARAFSGAFLVRAADGGVVV